MKSTINSEDFKKSMQNADDNTIKSFILSGQLFGIALSENNADNVKKSYVMFLDKAKELEKASGYQFLSSPDDKYFAALRTLAQAILKNNKNATSPISEEKTMHFSSAKEANDFLREHDSIKVINMNVDTVNKLGLFANHSAVKNITISYMELNNSTGIKYGFCEEEKTALFVSGNDDKYIKDWESAHPGCKITHMRKTSNSRGSASSLAFGFGIDRVEHNRYMFVYAENKS